MFFESGNIALFLGTRDCFISYGSKLTNFIAMSICGIATVVFYSRTTFMDTATMTSRIYRLITVSMKNYLQLFFHLATAMTLRDFLNNKSSVKVTLLKLRLRLKLLKS